MDDSHGDRDPYVGLGPACQLTAIDSRNLAAAGYDADRTELTIRFCWQDMTYLYTGVPAKVFDGLMAATESHNAYFVAHIKNRYASRQIG